jgi:GTP-binding protein EngB required for normal cell division
MNTERQVKIDKLLAEANLTKRRSGFRDIDLSGQESILTTTDELFLEEIKKEAASADLAENELVRIQERAQTRGFSFLLVGRAGVGKSSTINSLMGREAAPVGEFEAETKVVNAYPAPPEAIIPYRIYDTPGLCDGNGDDEEYLKLIHREIKEPIDCLWFVTLLDESRVRTDEIAAISHITSAFGQEIWNRAVIVFTRSDKVDHKKFENTLSKRTRLIRDEIAKRIGKEIAIEIPSVAVSNVTQKTPDGKLWLGRLFVKTFVRISSEGLDGFLLEIFNYRGLEIETDKIGESPLPRQEIYNHYHTTKKKIVNNIVNNTVEVIEVTLDDINDTPTFLPRVENWVQKTGRAVGESLAGSVANRIPIPSAARDAVRELGGEIGSQVATHASKAVQKGAQTVAKVADEGGKLVRNAWNGLKSIFR